MRVASCLYFDSEISTSVIKMSSKEEKQRIKILLAHGENPNYAHAKLAKLLNVTNVLKVYGEHLSTARKAGSEGNRKPEATATTKRVVGGTPTSPSEMSRRTWKWHLQPCIELKTSWTVDLQEGGDSKS